ncbi:hypothetical protein Trydic_g19022 [Trypoxylus dichotomus]
MDQKAGNGVPHELKKRNIESCLVTCEVLLQRRERNSFLHWIITGDGKSIQYDNPKCKIAWVKPGERSPSTPKHNIRELKVMLCIWWDMQGV